MASKYILRFPLGSDREHFYGPIKGKSEDSQAFNINGVSVITPIKRRKYDPEHFLIMENKGFYDPVIISGCNDAFYVIIGEFDGKKIKTWMQPSAILDVIKSKDHSICNEKMTGEFIFRGHGGTLYLVPVIKGV